WESTPDWGYAWFPSVAVGWAPYSLGSWVWVSPWGWTWVDQEPWGFAPFHYGRWGYWHRRWCWIPGPRRKRAIYAPALVGWVGGRQDGAPRAHVGWFPLGPRDVYVPGYHVSAAYVRNINMANTRLDPRDISNVYERRVPDIRYANSEVPGAVTAVPRNVFTSAQPVGPHRVILPHQTMVGMRPTTAAPAIIPERQSVLGVRTGRIVRAPPRILVDRPVVARLAPPRAPVSFTREQAAIRANAGRPLPMSQIARLRPNVPAAPVRLVRPPPQGRQGLELRTAPDSRGAAFGTNMSDRERALQQPTLPPARASRNDRPAWAQRQPVQSRAPASQPQPEALAPQQRQAPLEWRVPPQRQAAPQPHEPVQRFAPPGQMPEQRFAPPPRQTPEQRFAPPPRQVPEQRFTPPPRQAPEFHAPEQHFAPPERQVPEQRFAPPVRQIPQERPAPPSFNRPMPERSPPPRAAPDRAPERSPQGHPPSAPRRAEATRVSFDAGYGRQWQSPPPMYRPQESTIRNAATPQAAEPAGIPYRPPMSPPPMYRPIPAGSAAASPTPRGSVRLAIEHFRAIGS
ncbi:MAG: hypothetical protein KGJ72_09440, partial [Gammaproteobacteria bacterium]|nr:hypothetical protein [Gammaproteobacteria bacterium]